MEFTKIFFIGFNKTASRTITKLFKINGYKTQHNSMNWDLDNYECFSDLMYPIDFKNLYFKFPNCIFILNTRNLFDWIKSRCKHCIFYKRNWGYPLTIDLCEEWIDMRDNYYEDILNFFADKVDKLILLNIDNDNWINYLADTFKLKKIYYDLNIGKLNDDEYLEELCKCKYIINCVFEKKKISIKKKIYLIEHKENCDIYLKLYKNNFNNII